MKILFEDNHVLVADKPGGISTQGDDGFEGLLKQHIKARDNKPGNVFLHAIHRLDKPVSGLVLFAKSSKALSRLNEQMRQGTIKRIYRAEIEGSITGQGTWQFHHKKSAYKAHIFSTPHEGTKEIRMRYTGHGSTVDIEALTGRYHQIRATLGFLNMPIVCDQKYGSQKKKDEIGLSCVWISCLHPITQHELSISS